MSKVRTNKDNLLSSQQVLFDTDMVEGSLDISLGFRQCLSRSISQSGKDRYQVAAEVSRLQRRDLSKDILDKYTGSDLAHALRAEALPALCRVVGSLSPFHYLLDPLGGEVVGPEDRDLFRLARLEEQKRKLDLEIAGLRGKVGIR